MKTLKQRFEEKYAPEPNSGCWLWTAGINNYGYGRITEKGRKKLAHRVSWEIHNSPIPDGLQCLHFCDQPSCVNPSHLFLGTHRDNMADKVAKGRHIGNPNPLTKLNETAAMQIRKYYAAGGCTQEWLANVYGVNQTNISRVIRGKHWSQEDERCGF